MRTKTIKLPNDNAMRIVVRHLTEKSQWFTLEPLPDCEYEVTVKEEIESMVTSLLSDAGSTAIADAYREAAQGHCRDGELEVDGDATVSFSDDGGAYVMGWIWVGDDELPEGLVAATESDDLDPVSQGFDEYMKGGAE